MRAMLQAGHRVLIPAITDYEIRRELTLQGKTQGLEALDRLHALGFLTLTPEALFRASILWADVRRAGLSTADRHALDGDAILAAQALTLEPSEWGQTGESVIIATMNVGHLSRFTPALLWSEIQP